MFLLTHFVPGPGFGLYFRLRLGLVTTYHALFFTQLQSLSQTKRKIGSQGLELFTPLSLTFPNECQKFDGKPGTQTADLAPKHSQGVIKVKGRTCPQIPSATQPHAVHSSKSCQAERFTFAPESHQCTAVMFVHSASTHAMHQHLVHSLVQVWDLRKAAVFLTCKGHSDTVTGLSLSPDGEWPHSLYGMCAV